MNLSLISHLSSIIKPHTLFGMIGDNLAKELKTKINNYEMVFDAAKDEVYFRINGEARKIPFRDSKTFADQAKKQMNKYVTEGATVNFIIVKHVEDQKKENQLFGLPKSGVIPGSTVFEIYSTNPSGEKEVNTYQP